MQQKMLKKSQVFIIE